MGLLASIVVSSEGVLGNGDKFTGSLFGEILINDQFLASKLFRKQLKTDHLLKKKKLKTDHLEG